MKLILNLSETDYNIKVAPSYRLQNCKSILSRAVLKVLRREHKDFEYCKTEIMNSRTTRSEPKFQVATISSEHFRFYEFSSRPTSTNFENSAGKKLEVQIKVKNKILNLV